MKKIFGIVVVVILMLLPMLSATGIAKEEPKANVAPPLQDGEKIIWVVDEPVSENDVAYITCKTEEYTLAGHIFYRSYTEYMYNSNQMNIGWTKGAGWFYFTQDAGGWWCFPITDKSSFDVFIGWRWKYQKTSLAHQCDCEKNYGILATQGYYKNKLNGKIGEVHITITVYYSGTTYYDAYSEWQNGF